MLNWDRILRKSGLIPYTHSCGVVSLLSMCSVRYLGNSVARLSAHHQNFEGNR